MKLKNIFFIISFVSIFNIAYAGLFDGWFGGDEKTEEIQDLKEKQIVIEKKINQLDKKMDAVLKAITNINTASKNPSNNKKQQKKQQKKHDPNYVHKIDQGNSMFIGNPNAKVTVTEFFDFQ